MILESYLKRHERLGNLSVWCRQELSRKCRVVDAILTPVQEMKTTGRQEYDRRMLKEAAGDKLREQNRKWWVLHSPNVNNIFLDIGRHEFASKPFNRIQRVS